MGLMEDWFKEITDGTKSIAKQEKASIPLVYGVMPRVEPPNIIWVWDIKN